MAPDGALRLGAQELLYLLAAILAVAAAQLISGVLA